MQEKPIRPIRVTTTDATMQNEAEEGGEPYQEVPTSPTNKRKAVNAGIDTSNIIEGARRNNRRRPHAPDSQPENEIINLQPIHD